MKHSWSVVAAVAALWFPAPAALSGQGPPASNAPGAPILMRLAPPEGQVSRYLQTIQTEMESPMMPMSGPLMTMRMQQTQSVLSVEGEVIRMRGTIDSTAVEMAMQMPGMDMPDLSGGVFTAETDTRGRLLGVLEIEGFPDTPGFNPESLLRRSSHYVLPEGEVAPGDSWTSEMPMELPLGPSEMASIDTEITYTFVDLEDDLATLSFEGPISMEMEMGGMGMTATGAMTGTMVVDLAEGRYRSQSSRTSLDINTAGMSMVSTTTVTTELIPEA